VGDPDREDRREALEPAFATKLTLIYPLKV